MHRNSLTIAAGLLAVPLLAGLALAETIPRRVLIADVDHTSVQISPDGMRVGWVFTDSAGRHLFTRNLNGPSQDVEIATGGAVVAWQWVNDSNRLAVVASRANGTTLLIVPTNLQDGEPRTLASGSRVRVIGANATDVVASVVTSSADSTGVFRIHLDGSGADKLADIGDADAWWVDRSMRLIAARIQNENGFALAYRRADNAWVAFTQAEPLDGLPVGVVSASPDGSKLYYVAREGDTTALFELDVASEKKTELLRDPEADILTPGGTVDPKTGRPSSVVSYHVRLQRHFLDKSLRADIDALAKLRPGDVSIIGQSADDSRWLMRWLNGGPAHYAVWDRKTKHAIDLFDDVPGLQDKTLASRRPLTVHARDGLDLRCDVYLPAGSDKNNDGIPDQPLPTVVYVHGGPWTGYEWNIWPVNRNFQLLANRGYAVIRAGFRGEMGYGTKYVDAGDRAWGTAMHYDLVDIANDAVKLGIAKRGKIGIWGWSYGGYAVATALEQAPETFACGLAMYGVYDFEALLRSPLAANDLWKARGGDVDSPTDLVRIRAQSPINHVDALRNNILITHGVLDDRAAIAHSDTLVAALTKLGRDVPYLVFPEEGHDYARPESWQMFWAVGEAFLKEQLGGAAEPIGDEESRVNVEIRAGAERIAAWRKSAKARG